MNMLYQVFSPSFILRSGLSVCFLLLLANLLGGSYFTMEFQGQSLQSELLGLIVVFVLGALYACFICITTGKLLPSLRAFGIYLPVTLLLGRGINAIGFSYVYSSFWVVLGIAYVCSYILFTLATKQLEQIGSSAHEYDSTPTPKVLSIIKQAEQVYTLRGHTDKLVIHKFVTDDLLNAIDKLQFDQRDPLFYLEYLQELNKLIAKYKDMTGNHHYLSKDYRLVESLTKRLLLIHYGSKVSSNTMSKISQETEILMNSILPEEVMNDSSEEEEDDLPF